MDAWDSFSNKEIPDLFDLIQNGSLDSVAQALSQLSKTHPPSINMFHERMSALHIAVMVGRPQVVAIMLEAKANVDIKDQIGGKTPLHYAVCGRKFSILKKLLNAGANMNLKDRDGNTPLDALSYSLSDFGKTCFATGERTGILYAWGSGSNYQLGQGSAALNAKRPSRVADVHSALAAATSIATSKLHSVVVLREGRTCSCGFGVGGRLGHGDEETAPLFKTIHGLANVQVMGVSVSRDHSLLVAEGGAVFAWGGNAAGQLGLNISDSSPRRVVSVAAALRHSVFVEDNGAVWTCGENLAGQLGHTLLQARLDPPRRVELLRERPVHLCAAAAAHTAVASREAPGMLLLMGLGRAVPQRIFLPTPRKHWYLMFLIIRTSSYPCFSTQNKRRRQSAGARFDKGWACTVSIAATPSRTWVAVAGGQLYCVEHEGSAVPRALLLRCALRKHINLVSASQKGDHAVVTSDTGQVFVVSPAVRTQPLSSGVVPGAGERLQRSPSIGSSVGIMSRSPQLTKTSPKNAVLQGSPMIGSQAPSPGSPPAAASVLLGSPALQGRTSVFASPSSAGKSNAIAGSWRGLPQASGSLWSASKEEDVEEDEDTGFVAVVGGRRNGGLSDGASTNASCNVWADGFGMRGVEGLRKVVGLAAGLHHTLAVVGVSMPPNLPEMDMVGGGVPSLRLLCEKAAVRQVDPFNAADCAAFAEAFRAPVLRAFALEVLFRNLDIVLAAGAGRMTEPTCRDLERRFKLEDERLHRLRAGQQDPPLPNLSYSLPTVGGGTVCGRGSGLQYREVDRGWIIRDGEVVFGGWLDEATNGSKFSASDEDVEVELGSGDARDWSCIFRHDCQEADPGSFGSFGDDDGSDQFFMEMDYDNSSLPKCPESSQDLFSENNKSVSRRADRKLRRKQQGRATATIGADPALSTSVSPTIDTESVVPICPDCNSLTGLAIREQSAETASATSTPSCTIPCALPAQSKSAGKGWATMGGGSGISNCNPVSLRVVLEAEARAAGVLPFSTPRECMGLSSASESSTAKTNVAGSSYGPKWGTALSTPIPTLPVRSSAQSLRVIQAEEENRRNASELSPQVNWRPPTVSNASSQNSAISGQATISGPPGPIAGLSFCERGRSRRRPQRGDDQVAATLPTASKLASTTTEVKQGVEIARNIPPVVSLASIQADEARRQESFLPQRRSDGQGKAWANRPRVAAASLEDIQKQEAWDAEEREALELIRIHLGSDALP